MSRSGDLFTRYNYLNEKITTRGYVTKHGVHYSFSRGKYATAIFAKTTTGVDRYHILAFKTNEVIHPMGWAASGLSNSNDAEQTLKTWKLAAHQYKILKKEYSNLTPEKFLETTINKEGLNAAYIYKMFPELEAVKQENEIDVAGFQLDYQNDKDKAALSTILTDAAKILTKNGLKKLLYGNVYSTPSLGRSAIANYTFNTDAISMSNKAKKGADSVRYLIHELGHRLWYKHLTEAQKSDIHNKYLEVIQNPELKVHVGDKFKGDKGQEVEVVDLKLGRNDVKYIFTEGGNDKPRFQATKGYFRNLKPIKVKETVERNIFDVTSYARTSPEEFWSEIFSFALTKRNKEILDYVRQFF